MPLRDLLRKKEHVEVSPSASLGAEQGYSNVTIIRSDTLGQEIISEPQEAQQSKGHSRFRSHSTDSTIAKDKSERRLSSLFSLRSPSAELRHQSVNIPGNLPVISASGGEKDDEEAQWEKRATLLARRNPSTDFTRGTSSRPIVSRQISDAQGDVGLPRFDCPIGGRLHCTG
jgi:hypothetical protein